MLQPFSPAGTVTIAGTAASARVQLPIADSQQVEIAVVAGGGVAFVRFGDSNVAAAATDYPVLPGTTRRLTIGPTSTHIAAIVPGGTATVYATTGQGG